jgi:hypothetical protein
VVGCVRRILSQKREATTSRVEPSVKILNVEAALRHRFVDIAYRSFVILVFSCGVLGLVVRKLAYYDG